MSYLGLYVQPAPVLVLDRYVTLIDEPIKAVGGDQKGVSVAQWLGRRTSDPAVMGSIPGPRVIRHLGQLSLPSLRGR